jgi:hypothetical protein
VFVSIKEGDLKGFDQLEEKSYKDKKKNKCDFKLLQLLIEEKDPKERRTGNATATKHGIIKARTQQAVPQPAVSKKYLLSQSSQSTSKPASLLPAATSSTAVADAAANCPTSSAN